MPTHNRLAAYDVMRIVAIIAVLLNHLPAYHIYHDGQGAAAVCGLVLSIGIRIGVPLFAMVSGALLLGRNESYSDLWRKRIVRMLLVIVIFEALLYVEFHFTRGTALSFAEFFRGMLAGTLPGTTSYWFLYAYLGFLFMLPFLRRVAQAMTRADFLWLMGVHIVLTTGPIVATFVSACCGWPELKLSSALAVSLSSVTLYFYPLIGYWVDRNIDVQRLTPRQWRLITLVTLLGIALSAAMTSYYIHRFGGSTQSYLSLTVYVTAIAIFLAVKRLFDAAFARRRPRLNRALCLAGSLVFGVYLMDQHLKLVLYEPLQQILTSSLQPPKTPSTSPEGGVISAAAPITYYLLPLTSSLVWCAVTFTLCGAVTWLLKRLPVFRKLL